MLSLIIRFAILIVCCLISASLVDALNIGVDTVWPAGTYTITDNIIIRNNSTLTIEDGATVEFATDGLLWVQVGALVATGVTFTWSDGTNEWRGIYFSGSCSGSRLVDCTIEHSKGYSDRAPAMIYMYGDVVDPGLLIEACTIGNGTAEQGIRAAGGASPQILNNTFTGFSDAAVNLASAHTPIVTGNTFDSNTVGVHVYYGSNTAPTITDNTYLYSADCDVKVAGNIKRDVAWNEDPGTVYRVAPTNGVIAIEGNGYLTIIDGIIVKVNPDKIFWVRSGGVLDATGVTFTAADENDEWNAIWFYSGDSRSRLENCVIERAEGRSTEDYAMVYINGGGSPNIIGCTFGNGEAQRGIHVTGGGSPQILNNTISGFSDYGVYVTYPQSAPFIAGNTITGNKRGIGSFVQSKIIVSRVNSIEGNIEYGFFAGESYTYSVADARYNWWGSATGPTFTGNPLGTGDEITDKVDYLPFFGSIADIEPDGMWDEWEILKFTDTITATEISDFDDDGLLDTEEFLYGSDPKNNDSDGDGVFDGLEIQCFLNPLLAGDFGLDSDNDGFSDLRELISGTDQWDSLDIPEIIADGEPQPSGDGDVDGKDLKAFITEIGSFNCSACQFDLDHDGDVDRADLFLFAEDYGRM